MVKPELYIKNSTLSGNPRKNGHVRQFWFSP